MKVKHKRLVVQERDIEILRFLQGMGFITLKQAWIRFWLTDTEKIKEYFEQWTAIQNDNFLSTSKKQSKILKLENLKSKAAFMRLRILENALLIKRVHNPISRESVFILGSLGEAELFARGFDTLNRKKAVSPATFEHYSRINYVRCISEVFGICKEWTSERALKYYLKSDTLSDGMFVAGNDKKVSIEVEIRTKKRGRYIDKFKKLVKQDVVLYFCNSKQQVQRLCQYSTNPNIYFTIFSHFLDSWNKTMFINHKQEKLAFDSLKNGM